MSYDKIPMLTGDVIDESFLAHVQTQFDAAKDYTDEQIAEIEVPVTSVNNKTGDVSLNASDVGAETPAGAQAKVDAHADDGSAHGIGDKSTLLTNEKAVLVGAINELFTYVSDGKDEVATAITDKGVPASGSDTFTQLAGKIGQIQTGLSFIETEAGDAVVAASPDQVSTSVNFPSNLMKDIEVNFEGTVKISAEGSTLSSGAVGYMNFGKNGSNIGGSSLTRPLLDSNEWKKYELTVEVSPGDVLQTGVYRSTGTSGTVYLRNFEVSVDPDSLASFIGQHFADVLS